MYDRAGEEHYNIIRCVVAVVGVRCYVCPLRFMLRVGSAFHKSMRGSDIDASLYWLGRMLVSGEDPRYVARRMIRFASEDVGLADPQVGMIRPCVQAHTALMTQWVPLLFFLIPSQALPQAIAAAQAVQLIGMPEAGVCLAQSAAYLAKAPKSVAVYQAYSK